MRFLLVSPSFPPSGDVGAKRALNLTRNLPSLGWEPIVLSCPIQKGSVDLDEEELVPKDVKVYREFTSPLGRILRRASGAEQQPGAPKTSRPSVHLRFHLRLRPNP